MLGVETRTRDRVNLRYTANKQIFADAFEISNGILMAPGKYAFDAYGFDLSTGQHRPVSATATYRTGEIYGDHIAQC